MLLAHFYSKWMDQLHLPSPFSLQYIMDFLIVSQITKRLRCRGILLFYADYSNSRVYVTAVGVIFRGFIFNGTFDSLCELLISCSRTSIRVYEESYGKKNILFEYNLDMCRFGILFEPKSDIQLPSS